MTELNRRAVLAGGMAAGAAATLGPIATIEPAKASANKTCRGLSLGSFTPECPLWVKSERGSSNL